MTETGSIPLLWRRYPQRYRLEGNKCENCGTHYFPPRIVCPKCRRRGKLVSHTFSGKGTVESYTVVHVPPDEMAGQEPYVLALVRLEEGPVITSVLCDVSPERVRIGMPVKLAFRKISEQGPDGLVCYGYKFTPDEDALVKRKLDKIDEEIRKGDRKVLGRRDAIG